jgi:hypothetical protein
MNNDNPWSYLRRGNAEQGLAILRERFRITPNGSNTMELGIGFMWVKEYRGAEQHFGDAVKAYSAAGDAFYGMLGTAKWCLGDRRTAVKRWEAGLDAPFAVGGLGLHLPLLLFVASILSPGVYLKKEAEKLLLSRIDDPRSKYWPGPLAKFVLGLGDENTLDGLCTGVNDVDTRHRKWLTRFYQGILSFDSGSLDPTGLKMLMSVCSDISQPEWSDEDSFLSLLWSEEFYIARHEARATIVRPA